MNYSSKEASLRFGVSVRTVTWWCKTGRLKAVRREYPIPHWVIDLFEKKKVKKATWHGL